MFTRSPWSLRKSAPIIGVWMSAMMKIHRNTHLSPKSSVRERVPKVAIVKPLTAQRLEQLGLILQSAVDGEITLTSVPVSTRKRQPEYVSLKNSR